MCPFQFLSHLLRLLYLAYKRAEGGRKIIFLSEEEDNSILRKKWRKRAHIFLLFQQKRSYLFRAKKDITEFTSYKNMVTVVEKKILVRNCFQAVFTFLKFGGRTVFSYFFLLFIPRGFVVHSWRMLILSIFSYFRQGKINLSDLRIKIPKTCYFFHFLYMLESISSLIIFLRKIHKNVCIQ